MRDALKRLERLEESQPQELVPFRAVIQFIRAENGQALPWEPSWARCEGAEILKGDDESPESFQHRAEAQFPRGLLLIGS